MGGTSTETEQFGQHPFGLTSQEETRAARLHTESIIVDMLFQGPCGYRSFTPEMETELDAVLSRENDPWKALRTAIRMPIVRALRNEFPEFKNCWDRSGITAGERPVELGTSTWIAQSFGIATAQFDHFPWLTKALSADDFRRAKANGGHAGFLNTQSMTDLPRDLDLLDAAHRLGLRMLQLTYNWMNFIGAGCTERTDAGISEFGREAVARLNGLGIIIDTAHCGRQTTLDACALSGAPVVASHTSARGLYTHDRGKGDDEICAVAATGGVIGICAVPYFLAPGSRVTIDSMLDHVDYVARLAGWQHVGIGTDKPQQAPRGLLEKVFVPMALEIGMRPEHRIDPLVTLIGFSDYRDFPNITRGLVQRGYSDEQIQGILGENFLRVFGEVCG